MSLKSKKLRKVARNAAMSALIVSAIVGTGVVASAATTDNVSRISSGTVSVSSYTGTKAAAALEVTGGTLYVDANYATNNNADGHAPVNLGGVGTNTNAWIKGGSVIVGRDAANAVKTATLTVDNMTIDAGLVSVTNASTLTTVHSDGTYGDIDINGGTLELSGTATIANTPNTSGSIVEAKMVNINKGGTLSVTEGTGNIIKHNAFDNDSTKTGAVNLNGGTIMVAKTAGLTIAARSGGVDSDAVKGHMVVATGGIFKSTGGTIKAGVISKGNTNFSGGTTTVDNLTVANDGVEKTVIEGGATVVSKQDVNIVKGTLEMKGGTLRVTDAKGSVNVGVVKDVDDRGQLLASAGMNTVDAKVMVTDKGDVVVSNNASLTVTKDFSVVTGGTVTVAGSNASLTLKGGLTADAGTIQVGSGDGKTTGSLTLGYGALTAKTGSVLNNAGAIKLGNAVASGNNRSGTLIVKDYGKSTMEVGTGATDSKDVLGTTQGGVLGIKYDENNVVIWGANLTDDGKIIAATSDGTKNVTAGVNVAITGPTLTAAIVAPSITAKDNALDLGANGSVKLIGLGMGDAANLTTNLNTLKLSDSTSFVSVNDGATLKAGTLEMTDGKLDVLNAIANIGTLKSTDGVIFVDPAIVTIGGIDGKLGAQLLTGAGSMVSVGGVQGWMAKPMADAGFAFGNSNQAVLGIAPTGTITMDANGVIAVDPTLAKDSGTIGNTSGYVYTKADGTANTDATKGNLGSFYAGAGSLTVLDVSALGDNPVFDLNEASAAGKVNIVDGAKLHIANLTVDGVQIFANNATGGTVVIEDGKGTVYNPDRAGTPSTGWAGSNLIQPDRMLSAKMTAGGFLDADVNSAGAALGMSSEFEGMMQGVWGLALNNTNSANAGIRLVSRAASKDFGLSASQAGKTIEGAAQLGAVAGVQGVTIGAANAATSAVATRTSFAQPLLDKTKAVAMTMDSEGHVSLDSGLSAGNGMKNGVALWIMPLYQSNNVWGQDAGNFKSGYNSDLGGVAAGVDYTVNDMFRFGAALNIGAGYGQSSGDFASTDNSFNFWGVNLYGGWTMNNFGLTADVGYTGNYNKVEQDAPASLGMGNFKSDINSSAWTAGLKGEYKIETEMMDIIPHIGVRYMGLTTEQYDVKGGGSTMFDVEQDFQSIWTFPIGVALSKNIETGSGWVFKPQLDLSVIPAAGDVEAKSKSRIPGTPASAEAKMQVVDYVTFDGGVGFDIGNENLSFGLNYNIQASEHRTGHGVFGTVRYEF